MLAVYLPLVLPLLAVPLVRWLSSRLHPSWATWLVTLSATVLACCATLALGLLALAALAMVSVFARLAHWSTSTVRAADVVHLPADLVASGLLAVFGVTTLVVGVRRVRALFGAYRLAQHGRAGTELIVLDDERPLAHALPGRPGRIVVSTSMLAALAPAERRALLAHERAHLSGSHHLFVAVVDVMAAANPLLRPLTGVVRYTTERWADEIAAGHVGDRAVVAHAVGKAALATRHRPANQLAMSATAGPVPRRVAALLTAPPANRLRAILASPIGLLALLVLGLTVGSVLFATEAATDMHQVLEVAQARAHPAWIGLAHR